LERSAYLHLRRVSQWMSRFRKFGVVLDGQHLDGIKSGAARVYEIKPGEHELAVTIDWVSSPAVVFRCEAGQHVRFVCGHPSPSWRSALTAGVQAGVGLPPSTLVSSIDLVPDDAAPPSQD